MQRRYTVRISDTASRELAKLPAKDQERINAKIVALADDPRPHGCEKLSGTGRPEEYRIRSGDYRIVYEVYDDMLLVLVVRIGPRGEVYRRLQRLKK